MSGCEFDKERLSAYLDGELSLNEAEDVRAHLERCPECRELLSQYEAMGAGMKELEEEPPAHLAGGIMDRVRLEKTPVVYRRSRFAYGTFVAAAAVMAVVFLAGPGVMNNMTNLRGGAGTESADAENGSAAMKSAAASLVTDAGDTSLSSDSQTDEDAQMPSDGTRYTAAAPAPAEPVASAEPGVMGSGLTEKYRLGAASGDRYESAAPTLPYSNSFYGILVLRGEMPAQLEEYEAVRVNDSETHIILPAEELQTLIMDLDEAGTVYEYFDGEPNTSPEAGNGIVVIFSGQPDAG